jgi:hypothetical protein
VQAHDSGPVWLAGPSPYGSCIRYSMPVIRRFPDPAASDAIARRWKLVGHNVDGTRATQLFDLASGPAHAEHIARLRTEMLRWRDELDDDF